MSDAFDKGPLCTIQAKLPVIGRAVAGALDAVTQDRSDRGEREGMWAALSEFLAKQSH